MKTPYSSTIVGIYASLSSHFCFICHNKYLKSPNPNASRQLNMKILNYLGLLYFPNPYDPAVLRIAPGIYTNHINHCSVLTAYVRTNNAAQTINLLIIYFSRKRAIKFKPAMSFVSKPNMTLNHPFC